MSCYHPTTMFRVRSGRDPETGKWPLTSSRERGLDGFPVEVPCGHCIGCKLDKAQQWATRCLHEAKCHETNCFITLTYDDQHLPPNGSLVKEDFQKFMKRLRRGIENGRVNAQGNRQNNRRNTVRYFACSEYGEQSLRPHYHACLFGFDFSDKKLWARRDGVELYRSDQLSKLWPYGYSTIGEVTEQSAGYVARYTLGKLAGRDGKDIYDRTGREKEKLYMSLKPGIGTEWYKRNKGELYRDDAIVNRGGRLQKIPRYYDKLYERENSQHRLEVSKFKRRVRARDKNPEINTYEHRLLAEEYKNFKVKFTREVDIWQ